MKRKQSTAGKIRRLIDQGHTNKAIIEKLGIKPQAVYNIRYQINKARGLGAIGTPTPVPVEGIGAPPKKRTRKVRAGTGITPPPAEAWMPPPLLPVPEPSKPNEIKELPITMIEPPTLWQRIKGWFRG